MLRLTVNIDDVKHDLEIIVTRPFCLISVALIRRTEPKRCISVFIFQVQKRLFIKCFNISMSHSSRGQVSVHCSLNANMNPVGTMTHTKKKYHNYVFKREKEIY